MPVIDYKLTLRDNTDSKWTEVVKKIINGLLDYASKTNKFRTVRIGEHAEVDDLPGFYLMFPGLDDQERLAFARSEHEFKFECLYTVKGEDHRAALEELVEIHGAMLAKLDEDHSMAGVPDGVPVVGVPSVYDVDVAGFATGSESGTAALSREYLYGAMVIIVKSKLNLRG